MGGGLYAFQRRASAHPEQALRYNRTPTGQPLWAAMRGRPPAGAPPACERCGAARTFEFQLMPQLLCALEAAAEEEAAAAGGAGAAAAVPSPPPNTDPQRAPTTADDADALDWGIVAVYTCSASCAAAPPTAPNDASSAYAVEYCWHMPLA